MPWWLISRKRCRVANDSPAWWPSTASIAAFKARVWANDFWAGLLTALLGEFCSPEKAARLESLFAELCAIKPSLAVDLASNTACALFVQGRWAGAYRLIGLTSEAPGAEPLEVARELNRRVLLEKNMDRWSDARVSSDRALLLTRENRPPPELQARVLINRSSVVFDLGPRQEVPDILEGAARAAQDTPFLLSAVRNNAGLYQHYHDRLEEAEGLFRSALALAADHEVQVGYVQVNLSLLLLSRALVAPALLDEAEQLSAEALERFRKAGHTQGVSYATSNRGLFHMVRGSWDEAEACFQETRRIARRLGEKWTLYGAMANSACLQLRKKDELSKGLGLADEAMEMASSNEDRKGIGDAGLLAGGIRLELLRAGSADETVAPEAARKLVRAHEAFANLGQGLGQTMAAWGLQELSAYCPAVEPLAEAHPPSSLAGTCYENLPAKILPLPWHMFLLVEVF